MTKLRPYQEQAIASIFDFWQSGGGNPLVEMATGCHARGTMILMFDGSMKAVEDVVVGDQIMGPDSKPRNVLALARGREEMARITPNRGGAPFVVNLGHLLPLVKTQRSSSPDALPSRKGGGITVKSVRDWLSATKTFQHMHKIFRVGVDFPERAAPPIDPWIVGALLGDGSVLGCVNITTMDQEIDVRFREWARAIGCDVRHSQKAEPNKAWTLNLKSREPKNRNPSPAQILLRQAGIYGVACGEKFIPDDYKFGSRQTRLAVLAGLIDTDGSITCGGFEITSKSKRLIDDVCFIARSLGFCSSEPTERKMWCGSYYRTHIGGDLSGVPVVLERKRLGQRLQKKSHLRTGFSVEVLPEDDFYGFSLDADHLYLTADFTVHHNTGKSLVIAELTRRVLDGWPQGRVLMLVHVRELVEQNFRALMRVWPQAPAGIYSAGLGRRDAHHRITFASIQSVFKKAHVLGPRDLILVDEAHLIPADSETMYQTLISGLKKQVPDLRIAGFTATPYRLGSGRIDKGDGRLFDETVFRYDIGRGIEDGFLSSLISRASVTEIDVSQVAKRGGEFVSGALEVASNKDEITQAAAEEITTLGTDRRSWLIFCAGVNHAFKVRDAIRERGISCETVTGETQPGERASIIARYKAGQIRCLTNAQVLTTGFDAPETDLVVLLRPTLSTSLYCQMIGRGTRIAEGKKNCLVLDYAGNVRRHGPVDAVEPQSRGGKGKKEEEEGKTTVDAVRAKECPECKSMAAINASMCRVCGFEWPKQEKPKHEGQADRIAILTSEKIAPEQIPVVNWQASRHVKDGSPDSLCVTYFAGLQTYREWICLEHSGFAGQKAQLWWRVHNQKSEPPPKTVTEALARFRELRFPQWIAVRQNGKYWEIVSRGFAPKVAA